MGRADLENAMGMFKPCPMFIGCGGSGKKKGKACKMCAGKGGRIVSTRQK